MQKIEKHGRQLVWDKLGLKLSVLPPRSTLGTHNTLSTVLGLHCKFFKFVLHWVCSQSSVLAPQCTTFAAMQRGLVHDLPAQSQLCFTSQQSKLLILQNSSVFCIFPLAVCSLLKMYYTELSCCGLPLIYRPPQQPLILSKRRHKLWRRKHMFSRPRQNLQNVSHFQYLFGSQVYFLK